MKLVLAMLLNNQTEDQIIVFKNEGPIRHATVYKRSIVNGRECGFGRSFNRKQIWDGDLYDFLHRLIDSCDYNIHSVNYAYNEEQLFA